MAADLALRGSATALASFAAMSTAELTRPRESTPSIVEHAGSFAAWRAPAGSSAICCALLVIVLYAAFAHGGVALATGTRIELAVAAVAAAAGVVWLWKGALRPRVPGLALAGAILLAAFACWDGLSVLWSVAPDQTWVELNRVICYVTVLALAILLGASESRTVDVAAAGFLAVALLVTAYAVGQKLLPGLHLAGLFDFNQTGPLPRLQLPLDYWNALALFVVFGVPVALAVALDTRRMALVRLAVACAASVMLLTIAFTYSRGGLIALAVALLVGLLAGGQPLRWLVWLGAAALGAAPAIAVGLSSGPLTTAGVSLSKRESAGAILIGVLLASLALLWIAGRRLIANEHRMRLDHRRVPGLRRLGLALAAVVVVGVLLAMTFSSRGLTGTVSHAWSSFTTTHAPSNYNPQRLLSAASQNRWVWWKEAAGAFSDRPLGGWGAGSFGVVHLLYRRNTLTIQEPHSVPLQFLSDTGIVGALLAIGGYALLLAAAARAVRRVPPGQQRLAAGALLAGAATYAVHSLYDWDWNIPGVTLPALLFLGLVAGTGGRLPSTAVLRRPGRWPAGWRALTLAAVTLWLCVFALSAELPELAASKASAALVGASSNSSAGLASAQSSAALAARLDPLSDAGPLAQATIALHRGQAGRALSYVAEALRRDPSDEGAWAQLIYIDGLLGDRPGIVVGSQRIIQLDPRGALAHFVLDVQLLAAPPNRSPTATRTPLAAAATSLTPPS